MKNKKLDHIKSTGFKVPKDYFESFNAEHFADLDDKSAIAGVNETGFVVPKDYFKDFDDNIIGQLNKNETPVVKLNAKRKYYYIAGLAASLLLLVAIFLRNNNQTEELSVEMVETYFEESDLDSYELAELFSETKLLEEDFILIEPDYNEDNLELYLLENADIENILKQQTN